jgi:Ca-activated chloride channel family protein
MRKIYRCRRQGRFLGGPLLAMLALTASPGAQAADPPSVMVIVDGSGSMWGAFDATRHGKSVIVREALRAALAKTSPQTRIGLAAFGHRRAGDCSDAEIFLEPEAHGAEKILGPLAQINPRGRGPLTLALREAAKVLPQDSGPGRLLLIHDDADNCQADPCEAAAELKSAGVEVHVVGVGTKASEAAKMACLPSMTGGRHFNAQNAAEVSSFVDEALRLASRDTGARRPLAARPQATLVAPPPPIPASGPPALYLRALPAPNTAPLDAPLRWIVSVAGRAGVPLFNAWARNPAVPVKAGSYSVEVSNGLVASQRTVAVGDRPVAVTLVLGAGRLDARVRTQRVDVPLDSAIIAFGKAEGEGKKEGPSAPPVAVFKAGEASALLPPGRYTVSAEVGHLRTEKTATVTAGQTTPVELVLNAGRLMLTTGARNGMPALENPIFLILEDDPDAPSGRREIARSAMNPAEFILQSGTYYAVARQGSIEARERLAVVAGDVITQTLSAPAGRLTISSKTAGGILPSRNISYTIERIDVATQEPISTSQPTPDLQLPPGRYRVEGRYGMMNVTAVQEIEVRAGLAREIVFEHQAATLKLRFQTAGPADVYWGIMDHAGRPVWTSAQPEPVAILQAGTYRISAEAKEKRYEQRIDLRAGENRVVDIKGD